MYIARNTAGLRSKVKAVVCGVWVCAVCLLVHLLLLCLCAGCRVLFTLLSTVRYSIIHPFHICHGRSLSPRGMPQSTDASSRPATCNRCFPVSC